MSGRVISSILTLQDRNFSSGMRTASGQLTDFGRGANVVRNKVEDFKRSATDAFKSVGKASMALGAVGVGALGVSVAKTIVDMDSSFAKLQAQTGAMGADLQALEGAAKDAFSRGYGESLDEVSTAVARVKQNMTGLDNGEISKVTSNAMLLANTFDSDVNEVSRGVNNTMQAFGVSADKAFDLFTAGGQRGLNFSNEMFDNVAEYAPLFGKMGYSAEEYFGVLERGSQAGVYNLDYVNDVMKEFQIRTKDGSKATNDAMKSMSKSTQNVWKEYLKGNGTVKDVASTVVGELKNMDDQVEANQIGVGLFGTKWEDLESDAMYAMLGASDAMKNFEGATESASSKVEGSIKNRLVSSWRELQVGIADVVNGAGAQEFLAGVAQKADELVPKIKGVVAKAFEFGNTVRDNWGPIKETLIGVSTAVGIVAVGMGTLKVISTVTTMVQGFKTAMGLATAGQWAMNTAMLASPLTWVVVGIAAVVAAGVLLYRNWDKVRAGWDTAWNGIKSAAGSGVNFVIDQINGLIKVINKIPGVNIPIVPKVSWGDVKTGVDKINKQSSGGRVPQYDVGSNRITSDHTAMVHKDEMIIPARQAQKVRQAGGNIDNIHKLINQPKQVDAPTNNPMSNGGSTFGDIIIHAKGVTSAEVVNEIVPQLKLALSNI
ncbi:phage tail tape measure protein [Lysinibacillus sphaericus]|uniref:Phage-related minor tail protein n=1 Tax=Lysinibacillus sphaericus OT4b.31 TaxID=1285586 RepID=R7Z8F6_LYSSH|nr:phage tail tape measure protein [Lysinibacillus sphaericus]EON70455.1 phage-related minor tail protein [Lysinibacillus sphaericus OT4b.31]